jgi:hypothetical protein
VPETRDVTVLIQVWDFLTERIREMMDMLKEAADSWLPVLYRAHRATVRRVHTQYRQKRRGRW